MCNHGYGESLDGCKLIVDPVTGGWRCWANHPPHNPRQRTAAEDRLAKLHQGESCWPSSDRTAWGTSGSPSETGRRSRSS